MTISLPMLGNPPPGSAEWLAARKNGIGASETAAILGLSRYKSALDVYVDKTKDHTSPRPDSNASRRGRRLEPIVLDLYEEEHGQVNRNLPQITSEQYPFMFASLDAARADDGRPVEAKTAGKFVAHQWGDVETDDVPPEYLIQITHQMIVKLASAGDIAALLTLDDFRKYTIALDPELAEMIVEGNRCFWRRVENREPPAPATGEEVERLYRQSIPSPIHADIATAAIYRELLEVRNALSPLKERETKLIDDIKLFMLDREALIVDSSPVVTWKGAKGGVRFDTKRFQSDHRDLYATYLTQSQGSRRFLLKGDS
jgi:putative phage-type endonuclease